MSTFGIFALGYVAGMFSLAGFLILVTAGHQS